ncbi:nitric oxide reductase activation protein NorD [Allosediminivita pacifica]|uniref:Nitric oxide reductase NorD protein n=1 Tax=Allosediminivita pacifica TaxID=1267769 RepID=A0A2T6AFW0_9RHOB|nr:VWA domain-containing protein [Allosediminivita pacifica]PTX42720.1 nitric oxide reductase NorD protein [Allosediminivita pacifica]GGB06449.1 NorD nitric oxide reductase activation protein [Allosediminivita pacifica]
MLHVLDLMEPEETVGNLWHDMASRWGAAEGDAARAVTFEEIRRSVATLFRALGGAAGVEIVPAPLVTSDHRTDRLRRIGTPRDRAHIADFDGDRLRLPPVIDLFPTRDLNRACYLWLGALACFVEIPAPRSDPLAADRTEIAALAAASDRAYSACPGLRRAHDSLCRHLVRHRHRSGLPRCEAGVERLILDQLTGASDAEECLDCPAPRGYRSYAPVPLWLRLRHATKAAKGAAEEPQAPGAAMAVPTRKDARREARDQADRNDSFIIHRFESIMSWAESLNINRMVDDDDQDNAAKAAEDQDHLTLSQNLKRAATRLRLSLDLSPQDAEHERLAGKFTYPEWNRRTGDYMPGHTRVLEVEAKPRQQYAPDPKLVARVKRQFAPLHPRRVILPRQIDGDDLDLDAVVTSRTDISCGREGSDRVWQASRPMARDLSVAILMDCSRSTEAAIGDTSVIEVAREALSSLAEGIDTAGDRLGIWGFSSLRRDRVFLHRAKTFQEPMSHAVTARIGGLSPGHYTRLGAAIRHASAQLAEEGASRRLLLVLTDGKPNDLDHYEGQHGIEDSRMAVREARALGQAVHGVIVDADGQDWFARIFGRAGFTLLPDPARLPRALPEIYQTLTMES